MENKIINAKASNLANGENNRLSDFIRTHSGPIIEEWQNFAQTLIPAADGMSPLALRNHIAQILTFIADDIESRQTGPEQIKKSRGEGPKDQSLGREGSAGKASTPYSAAESHAALRLASGFNMDQMVSEYRALRASVSSYGVQSILKLPSKICWI